MATFNAETVHLEIEKLKDELNRQVQLHGETNDLLSYDSPMRAVILMEEVGEVMNAL